MNSPKNGRNSWLHRENGGSFLPLGLIVCGVFLAFVAHNTRADAGGDEEKVGQVEARILPPSSKETAISGLTFKKSPFPLVLVDPLGPAPKLIVTVEGTYTDINSSLILEPSSGKVIPRDKVDGLFQIQMPVSQPETTVTFTAIGPRGTLSKTKIALKSQDWKEVQKKIRQITQVKTPSRFHWSVGLGVTQLDYTQSAIPNVSSILVSTKASAEYWLKPDAWNLSLSGYFTPIPITASPSGFSILFLGINARAGYVLPWITAPWRLTLMGGFYYATTLTSADFGYQNIGGLEFYPTLSRTFGSGSSVGVYFKVSPVSEQFTLLSLNNRELASGLSYSFPPDRSGHGFSLSFDWANLMLQATTTQVSSTTLSLGAGYRW